MNRTTGVKTISLNQNPEEIQLLSECEFVQLTLQQFDLKYYLRASEAIGYAVTPSKQIIIPSVCA